jgi:ferric-dicitrate binding protein FerR (iron transport regulator)
MQEHDKQQDPAREEAEIAELLRRGGPRPQPDATARAAIRVAARHEWRQVVAERRYRRNARWSWAAAAAVALVTLWLAGPLAPPAPVVAAVERIEGPVEIAGTHWWSRWAPVRPSAEIAAATEIRSGSGGRVALRFGDLSLRLDEQTRVEVVAANELRLVSGAVYVDAGLHADRHNALAIDTPYGSVTHVGTQYEARLLPDGMRLRVREGHVRLRRAGSHLDARAGEELELAADGSVHRSAVSRRGTAWEWAGRIAPSFVMDGQPLDAFLRWSGRETGHDVEYASPAAANRAAALVLRGSSAGVSPESALDAVMATTGVRYTESGDRLVFDFRASEEWPGAPEPP